MLETLDQDAFVKMDIVNAYHHYDTIPNALQYINFARLHDVWATYIFNTSKKEVRVVDTTIGDDDSAALHLRHDYFVHRLVRSLHYCLDEIFDEASWHKDDVWQHI